MQPALSENGVEIRAILGKVNSTNGPVAGIAADPTYLDISLPGRASFTFPILEGKTVIAYVFRGKVKFSASAASHELPFPSPNLEGIDQAFRDLRNGTFVQD